jgi:hypothetical protein
VVTSPEPGAEVARRLQELRVSAIYEKKKHFNAGDRKRGYHVRLGLASVVVGIISGSALVGALSTTSETLFLWIGLALTLAAAMLAALQTFFNFERQAEGHCSLGASYLHIGQEVAAVLAKRRDDLWTPAECALELDRLLARYQKLTKEAQALRTNSSDYQKAQDGVEAGEEEYTAREMEI